MYTSARIVYDGRSNVTLAELNDALARLHIPAILFVVCCIILGLIGNSMVIYVYKTKFRRSNHRYFILFIGVMDLLACMTGMPFLVASLRYPYLISSIVACKVLRYFHYFVNNSSGLLLVVISIERFRKICRPFKRQFTYQETLVVCWCTISFSAVIASPAGYYFTTTVIDTKVNNITGYECYSRDPGFEIYQLVLMVETIISIAVFGILYGFIIRKLWSNDQFLQAMRSMTLRSSDRSEKEDLSSNGKELTDDLDSCQSRDMEVGSKGSSTPFLSSERGNQPESRSTGSPPKASSFDEFGNESGNNNSEKDVGNATRSTTSLWRLSKELFRRNHPVETDANELKRTKSDVTLDRVAQPRKFNTLTPATRLAISNALKDKQVDQRKSTASRKHKNSKTTARVTLMLFSVSLAFAISFIPHLTLMIITVKDKGFLDSLDRTQVIVYQVFLRIFILNNMINPIIYMFCDTKFRKECRHSSVNFWRKITCRGT